MASVAPTAMNAGGGTGHELQVHAHQHGDEQVDHEEEENVLSFPVMLLTGHEGEIYTLEFSQDGKHLASAGKDRNVLVYEVGGDCRNVGLLTGHKNAVLELHWGGSPGRLYTCSADKTAAIWDVNYNKLMRKLKGHGDIVNSCYPARKTPDEVLVTASNDGTVKVWDSRSRNYTNSIQQSFQVLSVTTNPDFRFIYTGSLDNNIRVYDVRNLNDVFIELKGCQDSVTSLELNHDGELLLSNSMDERLTIWDVNPFVSYTATRQEEMNNDSSDPKAKKEHERVRKVLYGPTHSSEKNLIRSHWGRNSIVCSGSADGYVYIFDVVDGRLLYKLPGHLGSVNDVQLHPRIPLIASCSNDKTIYIGQL